MFTRKNKVLAINGQLLIPGFIKILEEKYRPRNDYHSWELYFHRFHAEYICLTYVVVKIVFGLKVLNSIQ